MLGWNRHDHPSGPRPADPALTNAAAAVVVAVFLLTGLSAALGGLGSLLTGHGWRLASSSEWPTIVAGLARHPSEPSRAYPSDVAAGVPGPWLFWPVAIGLVAVGAAAFVAGWRVYRRLKSASSRSHAAWATAQDERRIAVPADPGRRPWRLVAGTGVRSRALVAGEDCTSTVVFGTNGSGKTTGLVVPNVLEWPGSVVMTTTKPQDVALVHARRRALGPVWVVAPAGCAGFDTARWSPVDYATDEESADLMAEWLCESSGMTADPRAKARIAQAAKLIKPLLLAARCLGGGIDAFIRWLYDGPDAREHVKSVLLEAGHSEAWREFNSTWSIHAEGQGSVLFTAYGLADVYKRPSMRAVTATSDFTADQLVGDRPATLILVAPESDADRYAPLFTAIVASVVRAAEEKAARTGGPIDPRLLLALDEAGNTFRFPRLANLLSTARGNGIQVLAVYHDLSQPERLYGREQARTVVSNARMRMLLPGVGDLGTLRYFAELLGRSKAEQRNVTRARDGQTSTSTGETSVDLAPVHALQQLPTGEAVAQYTNLPPMRLRLRFCFRDRRLRSLMEVQEVAV